MDLLRHVLSNVDPHLGDEVMGWEESETCPTLFLGPEEGCSDECPRCGASVYGELPAGKLGTPVLACSEHCGWSE
jgi:hypothetical protein